MKATAIPALVGAGVFTALAVAILTWGFYGSFPSVPLMVAATLFGLAIVCGLLGRKVKDQLDSDHIGQDRSQLNPMTVAQFLILGKASAWTGAIIGGAYVGMASYVIPNAGVLAAAANDLPGVIGAALGGIVLAAAGIYLERNCHVPPPTDGAPAG